MKTLSQEAAKSHKHRVDTEFKPEAPFRFNRIGAMSLRVRVALGVALPILLILSALSLLRYQVERQLLEEQTQLTALQYGEVLLGSVRYVMRINDHAIIAQALNEMGGIEVIHQVEVVDLAGRVKADSRNTEVGMIRESDDLGCVECHRFPAEVRPQTVRLLSSNGLLRIAMPLANDSDCVGCHEDDDDHLGMLLVDVPAVNFEEHLLYNLRVDLTASVIGMLLVTLGLYLLIHWLVVRRVEAFRPVLNEFAAGNLNARLPVPSTPSDELGKLATAFNSMADDLQHRTREREESRKLQQQAMARERGRIARELHDGLAQLLGYVNTKAMAVRLMLKNNQMEAADKALLQLEEAARGLFVEVREAILNLKSSGQADAGLIPALKNIISQFSRLNDLSVELTFAPAVDDILLSSETTLQLSRIVQEALTNVRKHAFATTACVSLQIEDEKLVLTVSDNGRGFDLDCVQTAPGAHFGLSTMRERAETIRAEYQLHTKPESGTWIIVRLPLGDLSAK